MNNWDLINFRVLFVKNGCPHCRLWLEFIERINANLPIHKRIKIVDCYFYETLGIITDPLIRVFKKYLDAFPTLFIDGEKIVGSHTRDELEAFIKSRLNKEFLFPYSLYKEVNGKIFNLRFEKECERKSILFGIKQKIFCK